jgi:hypothetical protein
VASVDLQFPKGCVRVVGQQSFELVISEMNLVDGSALRMSPLLEGSRSSLFCFHPVRDSCLWIPIVERGQICWGAPALRPNEFGRVLRRALTEGRTVYDFRSSDSRVAASLTISFPVSKLDQTTATCQGWIVAGVS